MHATRNQHSRIIPQERSFAVENNIEIVFIDQNGNPYGRIWHSKPGSTTLIRRKQLEIYDKDDGLKLAKAWSLKKIENQKEDIDTAMKLGYNHPMGPLELTDLIGLDTILKIEQGFMDERPEENLFPLLLIFHNRESSSSIILIPARVA